MRRRLALPKHFMRNLWEMHIVFAKAFGVRTRPRVALGTGALLKTLRHLDAVECVVLNACRAREIRRDPLRQRTLQHLPPLLRLQREVTATAVAVDAHKNLFVRL